MDWFVMDYLAAKLKAEVRNYEQWLETGDFEQGEETNGQDNRDKCKD